MTGSQKIDLERSKVAERMTALTGQETLTDAEVKELSDLTGKVPELETRYRAAVTAEEAAKRATADIPKQG